MSKSPLNVLEYSEKIAKRAQWEAFEFTMHGAGDVEVTNGSHENPDEHSYTVHVEGGIPSDCTCPAWEYQDGACKHMVAVTLREPVLEAATAKPPTRTDGGDWDEQEGDDECACTPDFPCADCYISGKREFPG